MQLHAGALVHSIATVRTNLLSHLLDFRRDGDRAQPVVFGRDGHPEAVLLSHAAYEQLRAAARMATPA